MACRDIESESEASNDHRVTFLAFTTNFIKNNLTTQIDTSSVISRLTDIFETIRTSAATTASKYTPPRTFAAMLAESVPDKVDIAEIYKHINLATAATCDDVLECYAAD